MGQGQDLGREIIVSEAEAGKTFQQRKLKWISEIMMEELVATMKSKPLSRA